MQHLCPSEAWLLRVYCRSWKVFRSCHLHSKSFKICYSTHGYLGPSACGSPETFQGPLHLLQWIVCQRHAEGRQKDGGYHNHRQFSELLSVLAWKWNSDHKLVWWHEWSWTNEICASSQTTGSSWRRASGHIAVYLWKWVQRGPCYQNLWKSTHHQTAERIGWDREIKESTGSSGERKNEDWSRKS